MRRHLTALLVLLLLGQQAASGADAPDAPDNSLIGQAVEKGYDIVLAHDLIQPFGDEGAIFLQNGKKATKNSLKSSEPYCKATTTSGFAGDIKHAAYLKGQKVLIMTRELKDASFKLFGFGGQWTTVILRGHGSIQDADGVLKPGSTMRPSTIELMPMSLTITFECPKFKGEPTAEDMKKVIGNEVFALAKAVGKPDPFASVRESKTFKKRLADEEEARKKKESEEKNHKKAELEALGTKAAGEISISSINTGDHIRVTSELMTIIPRQAFLGSLYQGGEKVGAMDKEFSLYNLVGKTVDLEKPRCTISPLKYRASAFDTQVRLADGIYEITETGGWEKLDGRYIFLKSNKPLTDAGISEAGFLCFGVKTIADMQQAIGSTIEFYLKKGVSRTLIEHTIRDASAVSQAGSAPTRVSEASAESATREKSIPPAAGTSGIPSVPKTKSDAVEVK